MEPLKEDLDFLAHYGKKGMRWGVRNAPTVTGKERKAARKEITEVAKSAVATRKAANKARTPEQRKAVVDKYQKEVFDKIRSKEFRETWNKANTVSKGQKAMAYIMGGPFGKLTIKNLELQAGVRREGGLDLEINVAKSILNELKSS